MKTNYKDIVISVRKDTKNPVIVLVRKELIDGKKVYKRISTGAKATEGNLEIYRVNAKQKWRELTESKSKVLFREFSEKHFRTLMADCNERSAMGFKYKIENYLYPRFGAMEIKEITPTVIRDWQNDLVKLKGRDMAKRVRRLLSRILQIGIMEGVVDVDYTTAVKKVMIKKADKKVIEIYTKSEITLILAESTGWVRLFIMMIAYIGMRPNEVIALKWVDVDWIEEKLFICRAINARLIHKPKTGEGIVDIPTVPFKLLEELYRSSNEEWIFPSRYGTPFSSSDSFAITHFYPLLKRVGVRKKILYALKHSYATHAIAGGQNILYVAKQLRHSSPEITFKFYSKLVDQSGAKAKMDEILDY